MIEGFVFLLTGLQARIILERASSLQHQEIILAVLATIVVMIAARFIWVFPATYVPRWVSPALARRDPTPKWQFPFILAFTGIRGVVSLAAALAIPLVTAAGEPFPQRDIILAVTFIVIVLTLVGQGLALPWVIERLGLAGDVAELSPSQPSGKTGSPTSEALGRWSCTPSRSRLTMMTRAMWNHADSTLSAEGASATTGQSPSGSRSVGAEARG